MESYYCDPQKLKSKKIRLLTPPLTFKHFKKKIPLYLGRPTRDCDINKDEINDLKILLNTTSNVGEFLRKI